MYSAKIVADSLNPEGERLTTMEVVIPRCVLAELNTHKMISKNSASSRAMPVKKLLQMAQDTPYIPEKFGVNQKGMQSEEFLTGAAAEEARTEWLQARDNAVYQAQRMLDLNVHKQFTNRLLEPFLWHTCILTGTEWSNFFHLRCHPMAHPSIRTTAELMSEQYGVSQPKLLAQGDWHRPYTDDEDLAVCDIDTLVKVSTGRCARVSYLTHDGRKDHSEDIKLHDRIVAPGHMSPLEHPARPLTAVERKQYRMHHFVTERGNTYSLREYYRVDGDIVNPYGRGKVVKHWTTHFCGNLDGWMQYRKTVPYEHDILSTPGR